MSKNSPFTTLCTRADKIFKIGSFNACIALIAMVCEWYFVSGYSLVSVVSNVLIMLVLMALFVFDIYGRQKLMADLSTMLLETASSHHQDIAFLKKILTNMISCFAAAIIIISTLEAIDYIQSSSLFDIIPYSAILVADVPLKIVFFIKFKSLCSL